MYKISLYVVVVLAVAALLVAPTGAENASPKAKLSALLTSDTASAYSLANSFTTRSARGFVRSSMRDLTMSASPRIKGVPELYVYDHCPFCVRVRLAAGILGVKHRLMFMENDDVETPTSMVGKKIAPIWLDDDGAMAESLDIIAKFDTEKKIAPASSRTDIKDWQKKAKSTMGKLTRPRYIFGPPLPEFMKKAGREAFVQNHPIPPYEKAEWKGPDGPPMQEKMLKYMLMFEDTESIIQDMNQYLTELESLIHSKEACTEGIGLSYDDIDLWSRLRSLTLVQGIKFGPKTQAYLKHFESIGDTLLLDTIAVDPFQSL